MKRILYLGLIPPKAGPLEEIIHYPVIKTKPKNFNHFETKDILKRIQTSTHLIITSKNGFKYLLQFIKKHSLYEKFLNNIKIISVGSSTSTFIKNKGYSIYQQAETEQAEGIIQLLKNLDFSRLQIFWPHSSKARPIIIRYMEENSISFSAIPFYDTLFNIPNIQISLLNIHEIFFTSPSTVDGFFQIFNAIPSSIHLKTIGPITENYLKNKIKINL